MPYSKPFQVECFCSCDKELALEVLSGKTELDPSENVWDWLGHGIYFWEQNPRRAWEYAIENSKGKQFNKKKIETAFVLGAIVELGECLNLVDQEAIEILVEAYHGLEKTIKEAGEKMPKNKGDNRKLDCSVIQFIQQTRTTVSGLKPFDTIRSSFLEGEQAYPGSNFTTRQHIQICVQNKEMIKGFFLPRPLKEYNPNL
jgi:hypothetical protein